MKIPLPSKNPVVRKRREYTSRQMNVKANIAQGRPKDQFCGAHEQFCNTPGSSRLEWRCDQDALTCHHPE
jgi:hypothetical protein